MKLSIITINYNNLAGLQKTIDSIVCQSFNDFEWIVIDGGSTDGSRELIEKYQNHFTYWCSEPDKGIYNAMNKGIAKAEGEYLIFMNSGDSFYRNDVISKVFESFHQSDIVSGYAKKEGKKEYLHWHNDSLVNQIVFGSLSHQATFIKRKLFQKHMYDEKYRIVSDWKFWLESIIIDGCSFEYSDVVVACQDMTGISTSSHNKVLENKERQDVLSALFPTFVIDNLRTLAIYNKIPTIKYIVALWKKSSPKFVFVHRIVRLFCWIFGVKHIA